MFITITQDQNLSLHVNGQKERFGQGIHEVSDEVADAVEAMSLKWVRVTRQRPNIQIAGQADIGPLTQDAMQFGTEGAKQKRLQDILAEEAAAKAAQAAADEELPDPAMDFLCTSGDCAAGFPTVAALERHVEMNHAEEETPVSEEDPGQGVEVPTRRLRVKGDGLGVTRKGDYYE